LFFSIDKENDATADLAYKTGEDLAQSTADQIFGTKNA
jgi:hypothetical protein